MQPSRPVHLSKLVVSPGPADRDPGHTIGQAWHRNAKVLDDETADHLLAACRGSQETAAMITGLFSMLGGERPSDLAPPRRFHERDVAVYEAFKKRAVEVCGQQRPGTGSDA